MKTKPIDTNKISLYQFFTTVNLWHLISFLVGIGGLLAFTHWQCYDFGKDQGIAISSKNNKIIKNPEFDLNITGIEFNERENCFYVLCTLQNNGDINATEVNGKIESNVKLNSFFIGVGNMSDDYLYNGKIKEENKKICTFYCRRLLSKEYLDIQIKSNKIPKLKLTATCNELSK